MMTVAFVLVRQQDQSTIAEVNAIAEVFEHETTFQSTGHDNAAFANTTTQHQYACMLQDEVTTDAEFNSVAGTEDQFRHHTYDVNLKMTGEILSVPQAVNCGMIEQKLSITGDEIRQGQVVSMAIAST